ncbi:hypothetical protein G9P44_003060 [Scheffersomyces stipitis]|nr:hypothetical protein G9P44_003060 [Scheffersomyces stipitis]
MNYAHRSFHTHSYVFNSAISMQPSDSRESTQKPKKTENDNQANDRKTVASESESNSKGPSPVAYQGEPVEVGKDISSENDFLTTIFDNMDPYLDTYAVYSQLVEAGFTPSQADEIINFLVVQLNSKLSKLSTKFAQEYELENEKYLFESAQQELRVDITRSREQHINELITLISILERDFRVISDELNNEFLQSNNDVQVAINDQKSENTLQSKRIILKIQETNHKITTELNSAMRSEIESLRWHLSRWGVIAILVSVFSGCAAFYAQRAKANREEQSKSDFVPLVIYEPSEYDDDDYEYDDVDKSIIRHE